MAVWPIDRLIGPLSIAVLGHQHAAGLHLKTLKPTLKTRPPPKAIIALHQYMHTCSTGVSRTYKEKMQTFSRPSFYWTRIQLLNPAWGSRPSALLHLDDSALISADSPCPPFTLAHTREHTHTQRRTNLRDMQLIPVRVWLNEKSDAHFFMPGSMNTNERQISQSLKSVCVCVCA